MSTQIEQLQGAYEEAILKQSKLEAEKNEMYEELRVLVERNNILTQDLNSQRQQACYAVASPLDSCPKCKEWQQENEKLRQMLAAHRKEQKALMEENQRLFVAMSELEDGLRHTQEKLERALLGKEVAEQDYRTVLAFAYGQSGQSASGGSPSTVSRGKQEVTDASTSPVTRVRASQPAGGRGKQATVSRASSGSPSTVTHTPQTTDSQRRQGGTRVTADPNSQPTAKFTGVRSSSSRVRVPARAQGYQERLRATSYKPLQVPVATTSDWRLQDDRYENSVALTPKQQAELLGEGPDL